MGVQKFLGYNLAENQKVLSMMGPSGTGKSFSADFVKEFLGYKVAKQITTRAPRPDDKHYSYMSPEEFVKLEQEGKILGYYSGDRKTLQGGNGYGYLVEEVMDQLSSDSKLILFPSAYELLQRSFKIQYGTTDKIGLGFKNPQSVYDRAMQCNKVLDDAELADRIRVSKNLTQIMEDYNKNGDDSSFHLIYSDGGGENISESKRIQLSGIVESMGYAPSDFEGGIEEYISR